MPLRRISSAHLIALVALVLSLTGGAYAAAHIGASQIKNNAVRSRHIKNGTAVRNDLSPTWPSAMPNAPRRGETCDVPKTSAR